MFFYFFGGVGRKGDSFTNLYLLFFIILFYLLIFICWVLCFVFLGRMGKGEGRFKSISTSYYFILLIFICFGICDVLLGVR